MRDNKVNRHTYRLPPCPSYDVEGMESWLGDLAQDGLLLSKDGFFAGIATFDRCEPVSVCYRLAASSAKVSFWDDNGGEPDADAVAINEHYGWEYVTARGQFYIYRALDEYSRELNTDPEVQAIAIEQVRKRERSDVISSAIMTFIYPSLLIKGNLLLTMLNIGSLFVLFGMALLLWSFVATVLRAMHLGKLRKKLVTDGAIDHQRPWRERANRYRVLKITFIVLIALWLILLLGKWSDSTLESGAIPLSEFDGIVPFATMRDFAPNGKYEQTTFGFSNTVRIWNDPLSPVIIDWGEIATVTLPDGSVLQGGLYVDYYETISPWIAYEVAREYLSMAKWQNIWNRDFEELTAPEIDADYVAAYRDSSHFPNVIIQKGNVVIRAVFYQTSETFALTLDEWAMILAESIA